MLKILAALALVLISVNRIGEARLSSEFHTLIVQWPSLQVAKPEQLLMDAKFKELLASPTRRANELFACLDSPNIEFEQRWICLMLIQKAPTQFFIEGYERTFEAWKKGVLSTRDLNALLDTPVHVANRLAMLHRNPEVSSVLKEAIIAAEKRSNDADAKALFLTLTNLTSGAQRMKSLSEIHDSATLAQFVVLPSSDDGVPLHLRAWEQIKTRSLVPLVLLILLVFIAIFMRKQTIQAVERGD